MELSRINAITNVAIDPVPQRKSVWLGRLRGGGIGVPSLTQIVAD
jgi:hypothetical protein